MSLTALVLLILLFLLTSIVGVVTGSNSLITVPVMFQFGIDEKVAVATNMFGLTFMAVGGTIPFVRQSRIDYRKVSPLIVLTMIGSALGAALVGAITNQSLKLIVSVAMILVAVFTFFKQGGSSDAAESKNPAAIAPGSDRIALVYALTFLLAIYGGLYSGGYVTILTAMLVAFFAMPFGEAVGSTKLINVFSSLIATIVFIWQGLVDYKLGLILGVTMFIGAYIGAHYAVKMNEVWLRRIFLSTVFLLAIKTLYDLSALLFQR
ncbi:MAG: sulfite exporter TauE/SafE family protein [Acidobacteria bacterium]|nr:sulfite exporter TauE/SafE family protein [Acidobacteriota bacterium]